MKFMHLVLSQVRSRTQRGRGLQSLQTRVSLFILFVETLSINDSIQGRSTTDAVVLIMILIPRYGTYG